jgi:hypothetical protein
MVSKYSMVCHTVGCSALVEGGCVSIRVRRGGGRVGI